MSKQSNSINALLRQAFYNYMNECNGDGGTNAGFCQYVSENYFDLMTKHKEALFRKALSSHWNGFTKESPTKEMNKQQDLFIGDVALPCTLSLPTDIPGRYKYKRTQDCTVSDLIEHTKIVKFTSMANWQKYKKLEKVAETCVEISDGDLTWTLGQIWADGQSNTAASEAM